MKHVMKRSVSVMLALTMILSLCVIGFSSVSAEAVVPRAIQRQWDAKWKNYYVGGRTMYRTGCGVFAIVNAVGYLTGNEMDVMEVARWANSIGSFNTASFGGTDRTVMYPKLRAKYGEMYGFKGGWMGYATAASSTLKNHLANGGVAIGHVPGHFIAVVGYDSSSNKFHVYDSAPSSSRGTDSYGATGLGDCWVTQSRLSTGKLDLDWFFLLSGTGYPINLDYGQDPTPGTSAEKVGTYRINSKAPASDPLNVRSGPGTSYSDIGDLVEGDLVYCSEVGSWLKIRQPSTGLEGYISSSYADYVGIDVLGGTAAARWGNFTTSIDGQGQLTITNNSQTESVGYDMSLPVAVGTKTTPYMNIMITPNYGNGYYFGVMQYGSYVMLRDCSSSQQLVKEDTAPYMTGTEKLEINIQDAWESTNGECIDTVRFYVAPGSSITINYCYFAATKGQVTDTTYNIIRGNGSVNSGTAIKNENLMDPLEISIVDRSKSGKYVYENSTLTVTSNSEQGYEVKIEVNKDFNVEELTRLLVSVAAEVPYDVELVMTTSNGDKNVSLTADFWNGLCEGTVNGYIPAANQSAGLDLLGVFTWNDCMPEDGISTIKSVTYKVGGQGTVTFSALQIANQDILTTYSDGLWYSEATDGSEDFVDFTFGDVDGDGTIGTTDVRTVLKFNLGSVTLTDVYLLAADYNDDGVIDTADVRDMLFASLA